MLAELRAKSQITIPKELVDKLNLSEGDKLEIFEEDGIIHIMPVAVYPKKYVNMIKEEIETTKYKVDAGETPTFDNIDALLEELDK